MDIDGSHGAERRVDPSDWPEVVPPAGIPQILVGGPGTGKTEFLCRRAASAVDAGTPPEAILMIAFSRAGVGHMRRRLRDLVGTPSHRVVVATYHSLAMRIVEAHASELGWSRPPSVLTGVEHERLVGALLADEDPADWPAPFRPILATEAMAAEVSDFILRAHEHRLDVAQIQSAQRTQWRALPAFLQRHEATLRSSERIDYGRALTEATNLVERSPSVAAGFALLLADEYQDTSPVQADLLLAIASGGAGLTVAADPYQSIYSFRGTDIHNVYDFPSRTNDQIGIEAERLVLTTSHRVPEEILGAAVAVTSRELPGGAGKVHSTRGGGVVACHEFSTSGDEAEWIAADIERLHLLEGVPLDRFAVFTRNTGPFVDDVARACERRGLAHSHVDERLVDQPIIRFLHDLVLVAAGVLDAEASAATLRRVLAGPVFALPAPKAALVPNDPEEWDGWLGSLDHDLEEVRSLLTETDWCTEQSAANGMWHVWSTLPQLTAVATDPSRQADRRAWSAYAQVIDRTCQRAPATTLLDAAMAATELDFETDSLMALDEGGGVVLATLHRAKGTEYDVVYIADATEGQIPDLRSTDSLLGVRHLNPNLPTDAGAYVTFRLDEERRLAYTAMTRASARTVWTATTASGDGMQKSPSRFMRLVAPTTRPDTAEEPLTPRALLADIRRTLADPSAAPYERIAALDFLADADARGEDPLDRYGVRPRGGDSAVVTGEIRLSPSQATAFDTCPRRYAIERHILTIDEETVYLVIGKLVHKVIEETEKAASLRGDERGTTAEALAHLDELWEPMGLGDDPVGSAWRRRAATMLTNLYELWPSSAAPVAHEIDLPMELDGTPWLGRADRVERRGTAISIVDYKTGRPVSVAEGKTSLQLGYYVLAASAHPSIDDDHDVTGAEFWYPSNPLTNSITVRDFDMDELESVRSRLIAIAELIRAEEFAATPGAGCRTCAVSRTCPSVDAGEEAFSR